MITQTPFSDSHMHTVHSPDGQNTAEEMLQRARELGLRTITFTDHCEVDQYFTHAYFRSVGQAYEHAAALRRTSRAPEVCAGIEIGQPRCNLGLCDRLLAQHAYDFVLASVHRLPDLPDFYTLGATEKGAAFLLNRYFAELERVVEWGNFDALAHLTYPMRLIQGVHHLELPRAAYRDALDRVLRAAAHAGKAIEVNTQGGLILPDAETLTRFRALGGRYVTLGSDAHSTAALGRGLADGLQRIRACGFRTVTVYRGRKPVEEPIDG